MSNRLSNAPLFFALAQAGFSPVAAMKNYVEEIQDRLRRDGYTQFHANNTVHINISASQQSDKPVPTVMQTTSWAISKPEGGGGFILGTSGITYQATRYKDHVDFFGELLRGLKVVDEVAGIDSISRLGVRYLDAVLPRESETIDEYLASELHALKFPQKETQSTVEMVYETELSQPLPKGTLIARVHRRKDFVNLPPDLDFGQLKLDNRFLVPEAIHHALIDTDHYVLGHLPLRWDELQSHLNTIHDGLWDIFEAIVSKKALTVWK